MEKKDKKKEITKGKTKPVSKEKTIQPIGKPTGKIFFIEPINQETKPEIKSTENSIIRPMAMEFPKGYDPTKNTNEKINLKNWGREESDQSILENKLDKVLDFLNSIETELIVLNKNNRYELIGVDSPTSNYLEELPLETLFMLQKHAGDIIQRNNYPAGLHTPEMKAAQQRFEKLASMINERINSYSWD